MVSGPVGLGDFTPGAARAAAAGLRVAEEPYPDGLAGVAKSLDVMAQKMRDGRNDPDVRGYAIDVLRAAGIDGRDHVPIRRQVQALLDDLRARMIYVPDPYGSESIQSAAATLCLRPGLCLRGGDCDDAVVALGSETLSIGIPSQIVKQNFGPHAQEHVLLAVQDESGQWLYADPSTRMDVGQAHKAMDEVWIDPMTVGAAQGMAGGAGPQLVTLGAVPHVQSFRDGAWHELSSFGRWQRVGVAQTPAPAPSPAPPSFAQASIDLANQVTAVIAAGDTYMGATPAELDNAVQAYQAAGDAGAGSVGPEIDASGAPNVTQTFTQQAWLLNAALAVVPSKGASLDDARNAQSLVKQMAALYAKAIVLGQNPQATPQPGAGHRTPWSTGKTALVVLGIGAAAGIGYTLFEAGRQRRRR
jgi:hypothetical protein